MSADQIFNAESERSLSQLPDSINEKILALHYSKCPARKISRDAEMQEFLGYICKLTSDSNALALGFYYDLCNFCGDDYTQCQRMINLGSKF